MARRWWLATIPAALALAVLASAPEVRLASPSASRPSPSETREPPPRAPAAAAPPIPPAAAAEPRRELARALPAEGAVGRLVQAAMARPGDSDPRLLDLLARGGVSPSALAPLGARVDPWLAVGLVDLDRQVARRCARRADASGCWERVVAAEEELAAWVGDPGAAEALARFRAADLPAVGADR